MVDWAPISSHFHPFDAATQHRRGRWPGRQPYMARFRWIADGCLQGSPRINTSLIRRARIYAILEFIWGMLVNGGAFCEKSTFHHSPVFQRRRLSQQESCRGSASLHRSPTASSRSRVISTPTASRAIDLQTARPEYHPAKAGRAELRRRLHGRVPARDRASSCASSARSSSAFRRCSTLEPLHPGYRQVLQRPRSGDHHAGRRRPAVGGLQADAGSAARSSMRSAKAKANCRCASCSTPMIRCRLSAHTILDRPRKASGQESAGAYIHRQPR